MKLKISSIVLFLCLILNNFVIFATDKNSAGFDRETDLLKIINIYNDELVSKAKSDKQVTRGELVDFVIKINNLSTSGVTSESPLWDVEPEQNYGMSIITAYKMGFISGYSDSSFKPKDNITINEAIAVFIKSLGYGILAESRGGYPFGYSTIATECGLLDGIRIDFSDILTYNILTKLLYNALTVPIVLQNQFGETAKFTNSENEGCLSKYFNIYKLKGIVFADENEGIYGYSQTPKGILRIDDNYLNLALPTERMLGYNVDCYYRQTKGSDEKEVVCIYKENNEEVEISHKNIESYNNSILTYTTDAGGHKKASLSTKASILYNGKEIDYLTQLNEDLFKIDEGQVSLVDNNEDGDYDVIFVTEYQNVVVSGVNMVNKTIKGKSDVFLELDPKDIDVFYTIRDMLGKPFELKNIAEWDVLTIASSNDGLYIDIIVSFEKLSGIVQEVSRGDDNLIDSITIGGKVYDITKELANSKDMEINLDKEGTFYLNALGSIAGFKQAGGSVQKMNYGLLTKVKNISALSNDVQIKVYMKRGEDPVIYTLCEKPKIDGSCELKGKEIVDYLYKRTDGDTTLTTKEISKQGELPQKFSETLIGLSVNDENLVTEIDTATRTVSDDSNTLVKRWNRATDSTLGYKSSEYSLGLKFYGKETSLYYGLPVKEDDDEIDMYNNLPNDKAYNADVYTIGDEAAVYEGVVVDKFDPGTELVADTVKLSVVSSIVDTLDKNGENIKKMEVFTKSASSEIIVEKEKLDLIKEVGVGDVVRYEADHLNRLTALHHIYDYSERKSISGIIQKYSNNCRIICSPAYSVYDGFVKLPTINMDINVSGQELFDKDLETHLVKGILGEISTGSKTAMSFTTAKASDIVTYKNGGTGAYLVIKVTQYNQHIDMLILKLD